MNTQEIISTIVIVCIVLCIYYFATFPRKRQQKELKKMQDELKLGDKVISFSGIAGEVCEILEDRVIIKTYPDGVRISLEKCTIAGLDDRKIE